MNSPSHTAPPAPTRRAALIAATVGAALVLPGCSKGAGEAGEVSATEDLMREHGVLRRILVVYRETAGLLRNQPEKLDAAALVQAADLFRRFGEDYHEKKLEEAHVFPAVQRLGGPAAALVPTLIAQHNRGREINSFVTGKAASGRIGAGDAGPVARALESFARMYEVHAALEDTVIFQAWKNSLSKTQLDEAGEQFEAIEQQQFNGDGFDIAVGQILEIERRLGLSDLARYTAPAPMA